MHRATEAHKRVRMEAWPVGRLSEGQKAGATMTRLQRSAMPGAGPLMEEAWEATSLSCDNHRYATIPMRPIKTGDR